MADYDLIIIGGGPAGYVAGIRAAQLGMKTIVIEKEELGGVCLNWGCIPSKAMLRTAELIQNIHNSNEFGIYVDNIRLDFGKAIERSRTIVGRLNKGIEALLKKNGVEHITNEAYLVDQNTVEFAHNKKSIVGSNIIIATGARPKPLKGFEVNGDTFITSKEALQMKTAPDSMVIVGGGPTGVEFAYLYNAYGTQVTVIETMERLLPGEDQEISKELEFSLSKQGIVSYLNSTATIIRENNKKITLKISGLKEDKELTVDKVLISVGMEANTSCIGLSKLDIDSQNGFINVNNKMETNLKGIYAIGDVTGKLLLAHVAMAQATVCVESIAGIENPVLDYDYMPRAVYCQPQVASFGITEIEAKKKGYQIKIGKFPFIASGKAQALGESIGLVKMIFDDDMGDLLGIHMIGSEVTELLGEMSLAHLLEATSLDLGWVIHPHPSLSEVLKEAALAADGKQIHI